MGIPLATAVHRGARAASTLRAFPRPGATIEKRLAVTTRGTYSVGDRRTFAAGIRWAATSRRFGRVIHRGGCRQAAGTNELERRRRRNRLGGARSPCRQVTSFRRLPTRTATGVIMRNRLRIQPYVSPEVRRKLGAYSAAQGVTESAVVDAALREYLEGDGVEEALVVRRLDGVAQAVAKVQNELDVLAWGFARFVRFSFLVARAPTPEAVKQMEALYGGFLTQVSGDAASGVTFAGVVRRAFTAQAARPATPPHSRRAVGRRSLHVGESDGRDDEFRPRIGRRPRGDGDRSRLFVAQMRRAIQKYGGGRRTSSPARSERPKRSDRGTATACAEPPVRHQGAVRAPECERDEGSQAAPRLSRAGRCRERRGAGAALWGGRRVHGGGVPGAARRREATVSIHRLARGRPSTGPERIHAGIRPAGRKGHRSAAALGRRQPPQHRQPARAYRRSRGRSGRQRPADRRAVYRARDAVAGAGNRHPRARAAVGIGFVA